MRRHAFSEVKVLDFTWSATGPMVTNVLAAHGAMVIRVESRDKPDVLRTSPPYRGRVPNVDNSCFYALMNPNKYSLPLNLKHHKASNLVKRLVLWADVVAENFTAGTMERLGLGYEDLIEIKPNIVMYRSSNQGQTGPYASHPGYGMHLAALAGFTHLSGSADKSPAQPYAGYTDIVAAALGAVALLAALDYRRRTGRGQCIDLSQLESSIQLLSPVILDYSINGRDADRVGNRCSYAAPHGAYRCQGHDRWCVITVFTDSEWEAFCKVIGRPELVRDPKFATLLARKKNENELDRVVEEWTSNLGPKEVMILMQKAGVRAGVVNNGEDTYNDPQLGYRNCLWLQNHKEIGPASHVGQPFKLSKTPCEPRMPSPCLGQHMEFVCKDILGMPQKEFEELLLEGVFGI